MENQADSAISALLARLDEVLQARLSGSRLFRFEHAVPATHLLGWLAHQRPLFTRAYWSDREGDLAIAALGSAWEYRLAAQADIRGGFTAARQWLSGSRARCLSYFSFSDRDSQLWPEFGYGRIFLPQIELVQTRQGCTLACNLVLDAAGCWQEQVLRLKYALQQLVWRQAVASPALKLAGEPLHCPDRSGWARLMASAFQAFEQGLDKVVLSRQTRLPLAEGGSPWLLMQGWQQASAHSYSFAFEGASGSVFLGCSPERLFRRHGHMVYTEALAGTSLRGCGQAEEQALEARLMSDHKNIHENRLVLDDILSRLRPLCSALESDQGHSVLRLKNLLHLRYLIRGVIHSNVCDEQLMLALHPTPAVGGTPRQQALGFIHEHEPYCRGLYAGACGIIGDGLTELNVSIRSALFKPHSISLYSGAGIVRGSSVDSEWRELDNKIAIVETLLASLQRTLSC